MNHEGDATIIPGTIKPLPNSFFMINHLKEAYIFRVTEVTIDNVMPDNYYKIHYRLEYLNSDMVDRLNSQTTEVYSCILDNIGTEERCIVEKESQVKIKEIEKMLYSLLEEDVHTEEREAYIAIDQAERSIILKGTHIGKDTCLYFYAEKGGSFYEIDPEQKEETILRLVEKNVVCEQAKKILMGD